jgi:DNA-binding response OmpR family regulator
MDLSKYLIISEENAVQEKLREAFSNNGFSCATVPFSNDIGETVAEEAPSLVLVDIDAVTAAPRTWEYYSQIKKEMNIPVIAIIPADMLDDEIVLQDVISDFVVKPYDAAELASRIKRVLQTNKRKDLDECLISGDLVIDLARCEVTLSGKVLVLTYMEYELLKFMASNKGRVLTRDVLLNNVWGYDYFGGDRTVDVHIRRLRSKIEDVDHSFIETVRNIGYRFKESNR